MTRREWMLMLGGALAKPYAVCAQQPATPVVGFLSTGAPDIAIRYLKAWRKGLADAGFVEGPNLSVEYRWAEGKYDRAPALAADLVGRKVDVINTTSELAALAAKASTSTIPIVFSGLYDPVSLGLVESLPRPRGNLTGVAFSFDLLVEKRLQLLHELIPAATGIGLLTNPGSRTTAAQKELVTAAARALGLNVTMLTAGKPEELEAAFAAGSLQRIGCFIGNDAFFNVNSQQIVALAAHYSIPTIHFLRHIAEEGGLISYSPSFEEMAYQAGAYVGRILKGAKPADLPVQQPTRFELVINLKTAAPLGLTIPPSILARADEVIE